MHMKLHNERDSILKYSLLKEEKLVQTFADGKCIVIEYGYAAKHALNKALSILNYVDMQLGIRQQSQGVVKNLLPDETLQEYNIKSSTKFYLYISTLTKKVIGFCMAEQIGQAFKIVSLGNDQVFTYDETKASEKATCGISRIWVAASMRRAGIATKLLDCVRINFLYFRSLDKNQVAFSDPTQLGQAFARNYFQTQSFLVYNSCRN